ncbi:Fc receptor-like protein 5, partial [Myxocyprinus asiaticus]|uniref:Fc receptor-like protein 5 n=1 Tax=Myxocyprinus asiaticus TaxID=70543 RepID=UPI0022238B89
SRAYPLVLLLISNIHSGHNEVRPKAKLTIQPDKRVFRGETVTLRCDIQERGVTIWQYTWDKDGSFVHQNKLQDYNISFVTQFNAGKYTCYGGDIKGSQYKYTSNEVTLTVTDLPRVTVNVEPDSSVFTGERVTLKCEIETQYSDWRYQWYKNNTSVSASEHHTVNRDTFTIKGAAESDQDQYWCRGVRDKRPSSSQDSNHVTLSVKEHFEAVLTVKPKNQLFRGETVTLRCDIQGGGDTEWTYSWTVKNTNNGYKNTVNQCKTQECKINSVEHTHSGKYTCSGKTRDGQNSKISDAVTLTVSISDWKAVLSVFPQKWVTEGDSVTLICEVKDSSTDCTFSWYKEDNTLNYKLLSDSSRGAGGNYTLSSAAVNHTGVYKCSAERGEPAYYTDHSNTQLIWVTGVSPSVSLIISPNRTQHFSQDSLSLSCEDQSNSTEWTVRTYTDRLSVCSFSHRASQTGSTCRISPVYTFDTGVYWCQSQSGEKSNPVNITVHNGRVILESPVHPVTEGDSLTLRCLHRYSNPSDLTADFYKDGSLLQKQTTGEMIIHTVSKSHEGFYYCKHTERGESPKSWISVRASKPLSHGLITAVTVGLSVTLLIIFILILLRCYKNNKGGGSLSPSIVNQQQNISQTSELDQSEYGCTALHSGTDHIYDTIHATINAYTSTAAVRSTECAAPLCHSLNRVDAESGVPAVGKQGLTPGPVKPLGDKGERLGRHHFGGTDLPSQYDPVLNGALHVDLRHYYIIMELSPLLLVLLLISNIHSGHNEVRPKAKLTVQPDERVFRGETVTLRCDIQERGVTIWQYTWDKDGSFVHQNKLQDYNISFVTQFNAGKYTCYGGDTKGSQYKYTSNEVTLTVTDLPRVTVNVEPDSSVFTGERVTLKCEIETQYSDWRYQWYKNNTSVSASEHHTVNRDTFTIKGAAESDQDQYWCRGVRDKRPSSSQDSNHVTLSVKEHFEAVLTVKPKNQLFRGETVTLRCDIQGGGDTEWTYSWTVKNTNNGYRNTVNQCKTQECKINSVEHTHSGKYTCSGKTRDGQNSKISDAVTLTVLNWKAVLSVSPQKWVTEGDSVTLICEVKDSSTDWTFSWYKEDNTLNYKLLSDSSRGAGGNYTLSSAAVNHTGVYKCSAERGEPAYYTDHSSTQLIWVTGVSPSVSLIISPNRTQHSSYDSLSLSCEDQSNSTEWTVRIYTDRLSVCSFSHRASQTGSTCRISPVYTFDTGVYWCQSQSGEKSNPVNITVHNGGVILESPVHPVTEGDSLTLRCLHRYSNPSDLTADFYKDGSLLQKQTTGEMIIHTVSKSHEGFYYCKHTERGESPKSWISVRASKPLSHGLITGVTVGLSVTLLIIFILILLWCFKNNKGGGSLSPSVVNQQQNISQTSEQDQSEYGCTALHSGTAHIYDSVHATINSYTSTDVTGADPSDVMYSHANKEKKKLKSKGTVTGPTDLTYAEIELKSKKDVRKNKGNKGAVCGSSDVTYAQIK